ncbi:hypothetical protein FQN54_008701 [Arachnomyces sp. PD_36]|nr:hypothetical protein FQN54_008701 [Arachnomyces sp. PD_36]
MRRLLALLLPVLALLDHATATTSSSSSSSSSAAISRYVEDLVLADESSTLRGDPIEFQLNFNRDAPKGVDAAAEISQEVIQQQPTFGYHDSTGINEASYFAVLMLDTTDPSFTILHYLQGDFQADGHTKADLTSQSKPLIPYHAPGTLGEPSGPRHYTFLLYDQFEGAGLEYDSSLPLLDGFDREYFETENGLASAIAGLAISVDIDANFDGGSTPSDGDTTGNDPEPPIDPLNPPATSPNKSITTTKTIGAGDNNPGGPTRTASSTSKRSVPSVITVSGVVISGYTPDAIPFTTRTEPYLGGGGKAMVTAESEKPSTAGAAPAGGYSRRGGLDGGGFTTLGVMATLGGAMAVAIVLM